MMTKVSPELLDRPAHLLFHASHAQPCLFRDFRVTIPIQAASEKYLPGQRFESKHGLFDPREVVARFEGSDRIATAYFHIVDRHMLGMMRSSRRAGLITQEIAGRLAQIGARCLERYCFGRGACNDSRKDLLDDVFCAFDSRPTVEKTQEARPFTAVKVFDSRLGRRHAIMGGRQWLAFLERQARKP
jgi:hypothetical protein